MEKLNSRIRIFTIIMLVAGVAFYLLPKRSKSDMTEAKMETMAPAKVAGYTYMPSPENPKQSYKMDARTYRLLSPFGIVSRVYESGLERYDVVLIAGNDKENFHDPRICFRGQGWEIIDEDAIMIDTARGQIPASLVRIRKPDTSPTFAVFFYKGPKGFYRKTSDLGLAMILGPLTGKFETDAVFYRFMPMFPAATEEGMKKFIAEYMDAAGKSSNNYF